MLITVQEKIESFYGEKTRGIIIRARARWHEYSEKSFKYFLNLEKRNHVKKHMWKLNMNNSLTTDQAAILAEQKHFYQDLYTSRNTRNISYHRAIKMTPYEAVYGIKAHREVFHSPISENHQEQAHNETHPDAHGNLNEYEIQQEQPRKRQKLTESQEKYNNQMIKQTQKKKRSQEKHI